jgi:hypothetical protein
MKVGEMWQKASDEEKSAYIAMSNTDKQRYQAELEAYNYRYSRMCQLYEQRHHKILPKLFIMHAVYA